MILAVVPLGADGFGDRFSWSVSGSIFYFTADNGKQGSDPAPILPSLGAAASFKIWGPLAIELTEDLYFTNYEYNARDNYPMACNPENRSAFVFGFFTGLQARALFPIGRDIDVRVYGGPAADLRIIALGIGLNHPDDFTGNIETDAQLQTDAIREYFWGKGRWFMPVLGAGMDFPINEKFLLGFDLRTWFPMYRLWSDDDLPPRRRLAHWPGDSDYAAQVKARAAFGSNLQ
ncbi:hypothetical protein AGMMS50293_13140 [Spirochaetia bacterium]|nr:hypothetical protein AGMMS50293_13140 [Spirochaetia bacterium]